MRLYRTAQTRSLWSKRTSPITKPSSSTGTAGVVLGRFGSQGNSCGDLSAERLTLSRREALVGFPAKPASDRTAFSDWWTQGALQPTDGTMKLAEIRVGKRHRRHLGRELYRKVRPLRELGIDLSRHCIPHDLARFVALDVLVRQERRHHGVNHWSTDRRPYERRGTNPEPFQIGDKFLV